MIRMMSHKEKLGGLIFVARLFLVLCISTLVLNAQSDRGTITGMVTDPTGAAIIGASLMTTNTGTGVTSRTTTGGNGSYTIALLPVGTYQVSAEQPGFKRSVDSGIAIRIGQTTGGYRHGVGQGQRYDRDSSVSRPSSKHLRPGNRHHAATI